MREYFYQYNNTEVIPIATRLNNVVKEDDTGLGLQGIPVVRTVPPVTVLGEPPLRDDILNDANNIIDNSKNILDNTALTVVKRKNLNSIENTKQKNTFMTVGLLAVGAYFLFS